MDAVERVAASDPNPSDPFRGLYISDETALRLTRGDSGSDADERLAAAGEALGLDLLDAAVLAVCAAPELNPRYGRLYAYLQDDVTRKLPSPRLVGHLLDTDDVTPADVHELVRPDAAAAGARRAAAARRSADAARRAAGQGRGPAGRAPARRAHGRAAAAAAAAGRDARARSRGATARWRWCARCSRASRRCRSCSPGRTPRRCSPRRSSARWWWRRTRPRRSRRARRRAARVGARGPRRSSSRASRTSTPPIAGACCGRCPSARSAR